MSFLSLARMMRITGVEGLKVLAVPLRGDEVAPRFCSAHEFLIARLTDNEVTGFEMMSFADEVWARRLERLASMGVTVLLCGGFNRSFLPMAECLGLSVVAGLTGKAEGLVDAFLADDLGRHQLLAPGKGRRRRGGIGAKPRQMEKENER
jgi:predicted Fe-Mo cluster-binding NifX family protein